MVASCKLPFGRPNFNFLLIQNFFCKFRFTRARENFFADSFTRVTGLIVQLRRGKASVFLPFFMHNLRHGGVWIFQSPPLFFKTNE